jgi:enoyl-CoA hydratase/carnithine racemase
MTDRLPQQFETILYEEEDGVAWVTLNRPEVLNAFNHAMCMELAQVWGSLRFNDDVRAVVLTGAGDKAFCTGVDRGELRPDWGDSGPGRITGGDNELKVAGPFMYDDPGRYLGPRACDLWKPVIVAVNGMACGGAFFMLGEADIIIASEHATFFDPHVSYGMPSTFESMHMLQRLPIGEISRLALLGNAERMSAERAREIGLVSEVVPGADLRSAAGWVAGEIAALAPLPVQATIRAIWAARDMNRAQALSIGGVLSFVGTQTADLAEGQQRFESGARPPWRLR